MKPYSAHSIFIKFKDSVINQSISRAEIFKVITIKPADTHICSYPDVAFAVLMD